MARIVPYGELYFDQSKRIEDVEGLWWIKGDIGSWDGPSKDWVGSHRSKIVDRPTQKRVVVQAGGNLGMYPNLLAAHYDTVYTFEPDTTNFTCLTMNCQLSNVVRINAAVGSKNELIKMAIRNDANRGENYVEAGAVDARIPTFRIDQLELPTCDLLWLDIEQYEHEAMIGAVSTVERCHPVVALETRSKQTEDLLESLGYQMVDVSISDGVYIHRTML